MKVKLITTKYPEDAGRALVEKELATMHVGDVFEVMHEHDDGCYTLRGKQFSYPGTMFVETTIATANNKYIFAHSTYKETLKDIDAIILESERAEWKVKVRLAFVSGLIIGLLGAIITVCLYFNYFVPHI